MSLADPLERDIGADIAVQHQIDAAFVKLVVALRHDLLFQLEARDAIGQQPARAVIAVVDGDLKALTAQRIRRRQSARSRPMMPTDSTRSIAGSIGLTQPSSHAVSVMNFSTEPMVTVPWPDCSMTQLPSHRRSWGQMRPHLWHIIGGRRDCVGFLQTVLCGELQPIGNIVRERAALLAERHAALRTSRCLRGHRLFGVCPINLGKVFFSL